MKIILLNIKIMCGFSIQDTIFEHQKEANHSRGWWLPGRVWQVHPPKKKTILALLCSRAPQRMWSMRRAKGKKMPAKEPPSSSWWREMARVEEGMSSFCRRKITLTLRQKIQFPEHDSDIRGNRLTSWDLGQGREGPSQSWKCRSHLSSMHSALLWNKSGDKISP